ncbi:hypothetical protein NG99_06555 [Erwinia typographi]|uniref:Uncharacterized protein n=2 Tax=Erwinia typographi TaxID=371042 RepID=A0A0A3Z6U0_9GAMM|nr:hypothetical protein NG99_06555 [Erwinia typographi]
MLVEQLPPKPLSKEEQLIFDDITSSGSAYFKPRAIQVTRFVGTPESWQGIFESEEHYFQWLSANRLHRIDDDLVEYFSEAIAVA